MFHFGPIGIRAGDDVVCSRLTMADGSSLYLVAHRTGQLIDAYQVFLYRIESSHYTYEYRLGNEDSFWWGSSLRKVGAEGTVEIRSFWQPVAKYVQNTGTLEWLHEKRPPDHGRNIGYDDRVKRILSEDRKAKNPMPR